MKSSSQLAHEAEATRRDLSTSLDGLRTAVTPSYVTTEIVTLAKDSGLSIARALAESARANPVPALLIGAGLFMMMTGTKGFPLKAAAVAGGHTLDDAADAVKSAASSGIGAVRDTVRGTAHTVSRTASEAAHYAGDVVASTGAMARETAGSVVDRTADAAASAMTGARRAVDQVQTAVQETAAGLQQKSSDLAESGQQTAKDLAGKAQRMTGEARNYVAHIAEEQPVMVAALGAAIGAAIGAALPVTETERQYLGSTSARVTQAGRETLSKVADVVKAETVGNDVGAKMGAIADRVVDSVSKDVGNPLRRPSELS